MVGRKLIGYGGFVAFKETTMYRLGNLSLLSRVSIVVWGLGKRRS